MDDAVLPEDIDYDPELILDSTVRYAKPLISPELLPGEEREMAVDEEEDEEEERSSLRSDGESPLLSHRDQSPFREEEAMSNPYQTFTQAEIQQQVRVGLCVSQRTEHCLEQMCPKEKNLNQ